MGLTELVRARGVRPVLHTLRVRFAERVLRSYDRAFRRQQPSREELEKQRLEQPDAPLLSVLIPVWNTKPEWLNALASSLRGQTLARWEACLIDGGSTDTGTLRALAALPDTDSRLRVIRCAQNAGISGNTMQGAAAAKGEWFVFCDHDDLLTPDALWQLAQAIAQGGTDVVYSDEDRITEDGRLLYAPARKPDFCPENLAGCNYICHLTAVRRTLFERVGGLRSAMDGSQDHDLMLRCAAAGARFRHIPRVLYHWRSTGGSMSHARRDLCLGNTLRAVQAYLGSTGSAEPCGDAVRIRPLLPEGVSIRLLLVTHTNMPLEAAPILDRLAAEAYPGLSDGDLIPDGAGLAARLTEAVASAAEDLLLIWDAALLPEPGFLRELAAHALRESVAAACPQVLDRHGRIAWAGYALLPDGSVRLRAKGKHPGCSDRFAMEHIVHDTAAVSLRCAMLRRDGLPPFTDDPVQWSLACREKGLRCVVTPFAHAVCREWTEQPAPVPAPAHDGTIHDALLKGGPYG